MKNRRPSTSLLDVAILVLPYLPPPLLSSAALTCKLLHQISLSIISLRISDASLSLEINNPIPFINSVDSHPYSYFIYTPSSIAPSSLPSLTGLGCQCCTTNNCDSNTCPCWKNELTEGVMGECGVNCGCGMDCRNRVTQRGVGVRMKIVRSLNKGWGLHADQLIKIGDFVCEYAGEFLTTEETRRRQQVYDDLASRGKHCPSLLVVREHLPSGKACLRVNIDATKVGNVARFINHSCDGGNLLAVLVRNSGSLLPRLCFFAAADISKDEELTFSYGDARPRSEGLPCFCGSDVCCGLLPSEET